MKDVYFEFGCFASVLSSVIESYPRETGGFIGGEDTGKKIALRMSPPLLSAVRKKDSVEFRDEKRYEDAKKIIDALGLSIIGGFHSHPNYPPLISEIDLYHGSLENLAKLYDPDSPLLERWLELVVGVKKRRYQKNFSPCADVDDSSKKVTGKIKIDRAGYEFEMVGYWIRANEICDDEIYPAVEGVANLKIADNEFPKAWELD